MKHILTTTAILLATATAINAQSTENQTLSQAISDSVTQYIDDQEHNGLSVDPEAVTSLATYAATEWNETQEGTAVAENVQLTSELEEAQGEVENLTNTLSQAEQDLETANTNLKAAKAEVMVQEGLVSDKIAEIASLNAEHATAVGNLEKDLATANLTITAKNTALNGANAKLTEITGILSNTEDELKAANTSLATANTQLTAAQAKLTAAETEVSSLEVKLDTATTARDLALANLTTANANIDLLTTELQATETDFNALKSRVVVAGNKPYKVMGNVLQTSKDNGTYSGSSFDIGKITSNTAPTGLYVKDYTEIESIKIKGKYSEFNIATDIRLAKNTGNLEEFRSVIAEVKNVMYNEGYKDGYNDGFEDGYNVGYKDAVSDIKGN